MFIAPEAVILKFVNDRRRTNDGTVVTRVRNDASRPIRPACKSSKSSKERDLKRARAQKSKSLKEQEFKRARAQKSKSSREKSREGLKRELKSDLNKAF